MLEIQLHPLPNESFLLSGKNYLTWRSHCKKFQKAFHMNEAAFLRADAEAALPRAWAILCGEGNPPRQCGCSELRWLCLSQFVSASSSLPSHNAVP